MSTEADLLTGLLREGDAHTLWCVDESIGQFLPPAGFAGVALCNRYDQFLRLQAAGVMAVFSDFAVEALPQGRTFRQVIFRIAKEKAVNLHMMSLAAQVLAPDGQLLLLGFKNEGMPSLKKRLEEDWGSAPVVERHKAQLLLFRITLPTGLIESQDDYADLQWHQQDGLAFCTKPGIFGWNKVDQGSALMMDAFAQSLQAKLQNPDGGSHQGHPPCQQRVLDLGCGYGYLSIRAAALGFRSIDATDNHAGAILACEANYQKAGIEGKVWPGDAGGKGKNDYDIVLCNPPFHQGFDHHKSLTSRFVQAARDHLKPGGKAWFVVNEFIGLEKISGKIFTKTVLIASEHGFRVYRLEKL